VPDEQIKTLCMKHAAEYTRYGFVVETWPEEVANEQPTGER